MEARRRSTWTSKATPNTVVEDTTHREPIYYAAFVRGSDGDNLDAVCHTE